MRVIKIEASNGIAGARLRRHPDAGWNPHDGQFAPEDVHIRVAVYLDPVQLETGWVSLSLSLLSGYKIWTSRLHISQSRRVGAGACD